MQPKKILVLGGTGRVGSSTALSLLQRTPGHRVTLSGRQRGNYEATLERRPALRDTAFLSLDINDAAAVQVRGGAMGTQPVHARERALVTSAP